MNCGRILMIWGVSDALDESEPLYGLLRFKLGFGGKACELIGEWDLPFATCFPLGL